MGEQFNVILADPPWRYNSRADHKTRFRGGAYGHYPLMSTEDICSLPVVDVVAKNALLFLWATFPMITDALEVIQAWGFQYCTIGFLWVKLNPGRAAYPRARLAQELYSKGLIGFLNWLRFYGVGYYAASNCEPCLLARRGKALKPANKVSSLILAPRGPHSSKPKIVQDRIEKMYPLSNYNHLELFGRRPRPGWICLGNDIDGTDIGNALGALGGGNG